MGRRPLLLRALDEHRDRRPNALIDEDHESLVLVTKKNSEAAAGRSYCANLHFDNGFAHTASLFFAFTLRSELLSAPSTAQRLFPRMLERSDASPNLPLVSRQLLEHNRS